jgi:hypothetical protein
MHRLQILLPVFAVLCLLGCGVELIILFIPAISATWCEEGNPCHKFDIWPDTASNRFDHQGVISGREFFINPADGLHYKDPYYNDEGENTLIGTFENLNVQFVIHKRTVLIEENEVAGAMEIREDGEQSVVERMVLQSIKNGSPLILTRQEGMCDCY